jgi:hypothetical protein
LHARSVFLGLVPRICLGQPIKVNVIPGQRSWARNPDAGICE